MKVRLTLCLLAIITLSLAAHSETIQIFSAASSWPSGAVAGSTQLQGNLTSAGFAGNVAIDRLNVTPDVWAQPQGGASWISFEAGTGGPGSSPAVTVPNTTAGVPTAIFYDTFTLTGSSNYLLNLNVFADDTTGVSLFSGTLFDRIANPNYVAGTYCAAGAIGCVGGIGGTGGHFSQILAPGTYTLAFDSYQLNGSGYGVMFYGDAAPTPEPSSLMLLGSGVLGITGVLRRRFRK